MLRHCCTRPARRSGLLSPDLTDGLAAKDHSWLARRGEQFLEHAPSRQLPIASTMRFVAAFLLVAPIAGWSFTGGNHLTTRLAPTHRLSHAGPVMQTAMPDDDADEVSGLFTPTRLQDEDRDSALEIDAAGVVVVEEVDARGSDDESDEGLDAAVIIVGAGAAGIGTAISLTDVFGLDASRVLLLERGEGIGTSFKMWPEEMKFISPSFNQAGWTKSFDLNSVAYGSSPAFSLHAQHPSGSQYADYLTELAELANVKRRVRRRCVRMAGAFCRSFVDRTNFRSIDG